MIGQTGAGEIVQTTMGSSDNFTAIGGIETGRAKRHLAVACCQLGLKLAPQLAKLALDETQSASILCSPSGGDRRELITESVGLLFWRAHKLCYLLACGTLQIQGSRI